MAPAKSAATPSTARPRFNSDAGMILHRPRPDVLPPACNRSPPFDIPVYPTQKPFQAFVSRRWRWPTMSRLSDCLAEPRCHMQKGLAPKENRMADDTPLWTPSADRIAAAPLTPFMAAAALKA